MADNLINISSEYDMLSIMRNIGRNYFGDDISEQRIGMFGHLTESYILFNLQLYLSHCDILDFNSSSSIGIPVAHITWSGNTCRYVSLLVISTKLNIFSLANSGIYSGCLKIL